MIDLEFFKKSKEHFTISDLLEVIEADVGQNSHIDFNEKILNISSLSDATELDVSFLDNQKYKQKVRESKAKFVIVANDFFQENQDIKNRLILSEDPYLSIAKLASFLYKDVNSPVISDFEIKSGSYIHKTAKIGKNCEIGNGVVIEEGVVIGDGVKIFHNCVISNSCKIGDYTVIYDNCSVKYSKIGKNCIIHPGVRIGQDGFGFAHSKKTKQLVKITHLGLVLIGNNVEIGANTCIDRGSFGNTEIEDNVKLDNLIQIGHNVKIGNSTVMAAQSAVAGSAKIGIGCMIGGQVGISGHLTVGNFVNVAGQSGIISSVDDKKIIGGSPAVDFILWKKSSAIIYKALKNRSKALQSRSKFAKFIRNWLGIE